MGAAGAGAAVQVGTGLLGAGGNIVGSLIGGKAANDAAKKQSTAIDKMKDYLQTQMDPALVNQKALEADTARAKAQLALQAQIDPALAQQRTTSEQMLSGQLAGIGTSASDQVAALAAQEGSAGVAGLDDLKKQLVAAASQELAAGATLPKDLQAELMQSGLQQAGQVTGGASGAAGSVGSSILSRVLGSAGIQLQAQREAQAASLGTTASSLEAQRQQILQGLFPKLQQQQMQNIQGTAGILSLGQSMLPQAGLTGTQVASDWLARVGAINSLSAQKANVQAQGALATGAAKASMWGSIASLGQGSEQSQAGVGDVLKAFNTNPQLQPDTAATTDYMQASSI